MLKLLSLLFVMLLSIHSFAQQCNATTKAGTQCKRMASKGAAYCTQHNPATPKCGAPTKAGQPCQRTVKKAGMHCSQHD